MVANHRPTRPVSRAVLEEALTVAQGQRAAAEDRLEVARAELVRVETDLAALVRIIRRTGGYMAPEDQAVVFGARAWLAERTRSVPR